MLRNWCIVYIANLLGSLMIAGMIYYSGQLESGAGLLGALTVKTAATKTGLDFGPAFVLGILCNWLVCLAVWISFGASGTGGKIAGMFFPIWLFVTSGFEHSIANMTLLTISMLSPMDAAVSWGGYFYNLFTVTLGNLIAGAVVLALPYYRISRKKEA